MSQINKLNIFPPSSYTLLLLILYSIKKAVSIENNFSACSYHDHLEKLYGETRKNDPHTTADGTIDAETKKLICESVARSGRIQYLLEGPVDMDTIYDVLKTDFSTDEQKADFKKVINDYERKMIFQWRFTFPTKPITFKTKSAENEEFAFACVTRYFRGKLMLYYISDEYKLDLPTNEEFKVRFLCAMLDSVCYLFGIAEEPSIAFARPTYSVNEVHQQMRMFYDASREPAQDPLCKLDKPTKLRVCTSVMSSPHFVKKIVFFPRIESVNEECNLRDVSSPESETSVTGEPYKEWMFSYKVKRLMKQAHSTYFISRAYQSHYAIVYFEDESTKQMHIENISGRIGPIIEQDLAVREEYNNFPSPILADKLKEAEQKTTEPTKG